MSQVWDKKNICVANRIRTYDLPNIASRADVLRGSSRVSAGTRDEPLRTSAREAIPNSILFNWRSLFVDSSLLLTLRTIIFFKQKVMAML